MNSVTWIQVKLSLSLGMHGAQPIGYPGRELKSWHFWMWRSSGELTICWDTGTGQFNLCKYLSSLNFYLHFINKRKASHLILILCCTLLLCLQSFLASRSILSWVRWLDSIADSVDMNWSKLQFIVEDRGAWPAAVPGVTKNWTRLSDWTRTKFLMELGIITWSQNEMGVVHALFM